jgi:hypothetical protein
MFLKNILNIFKNFPRGKLVTGYRSPETDNRLTGSDSLGTEVTSAPVK